MTNKTGQHIVKNPSGGWAVKKGGSTKATKIYNTKDEAVVTWSLQEIEVLELITLDTVKHEEVGVEF